VANWKIEIPCGRATLVIMTEIIFDVREDEVDGGYTATGLGVGIHT
jgi:hypothetical protein